MLLSNLTTAGTSSLGWGDHSHPGSENAYLKAQKIHKFVLGIIILGVAFSAICIAPTLIHRLPFQSPLSINHGLIAALLSLAAFAAASLNLCRERFAYFGTMNSYSKNISNPPVNLGAEALVDAIPLNDAKESMEWKKKLIESAENSIVISGNFCGGKVFDEILDLIQVQLKRKSTLNVVIVSSYGFVNASNFSKIDGIHKQYSDRFKTIFCPPFLHINPGVKIASNHAKIVAIDGGKYFLIGSSGIEDKYVPPGMVENSSLKSKWDISNLLPDQFVDQDYLFHSEDATGIGRRAYIETLKLAQRWDGISYCDQSKGCGPVDKSTNALKKLLFGETDPAKNNTYIRDFDRHKMKVSKMSMKMFCTGPEHRSNPIHGEIIRRINTAKEKIVLDHLYFHPTKEVFKALAEAAKRGVSITIISNGLDEDSPYSHLCFVPRSRTNVNLLTEKIGSHAKERLKYYEYNVKNTTLHKKVMVIDQCVISGTSNLGYKSLVTNSDHEMNFVADDPRFAKATLEIIMNDINGDGRSGKQLAHLIEQPFHSTSLKMRFLHHLSTMLAPLIG